jgi:hypothetical protein
MNFVIESNANQIVWPTQVLAPEQSDIERLSPDLNDRGLA